MGGEQYPVLMYGPKDFIHITEWAKKFSLVDKKEWVENFLANKSHKYGELNEEEDSYEGEGIDIIFLQEFEESFYFDYLQKFLERYGLSFVFDNNFCWTHPSIGMEVGDYNKFTDNDKRKVINFCKKYNLQEPTLYAGIKGELE